MNIRTRITNVNTLSFRDETYIYGMDFKSWLTATMQTKGVRVNDIVRASNKKLNQPTIQRILSGETPNPRIETVRKIEAALGERFSDSPPTQRGAAHANTQPGQGAERPPIIEEDAWKALPTKTRALVEDIIQKSADGSLNESALALLIATTDTLSSKK